MDSSEDLDYSEPQVTITPDFDSPQQLREHIDGRLYQIYCQIKQHYQDNYISVLDKNHLISFGKFKRMVYPKISV